MLNSRLRLYGIVAVIISVTYIILAPAGSRPMGNLAMPLRIEGESVGHFVEKTRPDLFVAAPNEFTYSPSQEITGIATLHTLWDGVIRRKWYSYSPKQDGKARPAIILFHGAGRSGLSLIDMWEEVARREDIILIAPNARAGSWDASNPDPMFVHKILKAAIGVYSIDEENIFLFGHSSGAAYIQVLVNRTLGPWRAAAAHAGYAPLNLISPASDAKPVRFYLGSRDHIFSSDGAKAVGYKLAESGHEAELVIIPGHSHWFYEAGPKITDDAWKWFKSFTY